jgi:uncharacterized membrane protein
MSMTTIARGDASRISEPRRILARSDDEWRALWAVHAGPDIEPPAVDFGTVTVAAAFAGEKPSAGYSIDISAADPALRSAADPADYAVGSAADHADYADRGIGLVVEERGPAGGTVAAAIVTSPFHIVAVHRGLGEVTWVEAGGASREARGASSGDPGVRASRLAPRASISSTGLEPRTASALAYLAGPFSGALILLAESANDHVRFHAWQSIVGLGGLGLAVVASYILAFAALFVSATAVSLMVGVAYVIWIVLAIVWALCLWKAWSGERWKLPLAGDYAERLL